MRIASRLYDNKPSCWLVMGSTAWWLLALAALLAPALWNGFALVFFDSGGYVCRVLEMNLAPGRSFFYGAFLWLTSLGWWSFWGPVLVQSGVCLWQTQLLVRCHNIPGGSWTAASICLALAAGTGISWYSSQLMPDILAPQLVLALWLLSACGPQLRPLERTGLWLWAVVALLSHMASLGLAAGLLLITIAARLLPARHRLRLRLWPAATALAAAVIIMPTVHSLLVGQAGFTPGGPVFIFGRLVQDGLAKRWLDEHCPVDGVQLCALRHQLPATADDFLWSGDSSFLTIGGWSKEAERELRFLNWSILRAYPGAVAATSAVATWQQLTMVATGDGLDEFQPGTVGIFSDLLPPATGASFDQARQQHQEITQRLFDQFNSLHVPVSLTACLLLPLIALWQWRRGRSDLAGLTCYVLLALLGNAMICGILSNPHDRYQSRMVWLALLVVLLVLGAEKHEHPANLSNLPSDPAHE